MDKPIYFDGSGNIHLGLQKGAITVIRPSEEGKSTPIINYPYPVHV